MVGDSDDEPYVQEDDDEYGEEGVVEVGADDDAEDLANYKGIYFNDDQG